MCSFDTCSLSITTLLAVGAILASFINEHLQDDCLKDTAKALLWFQAGVTFCVTIFYCIPFVKKILGRIVVVIDWLLLCIAVATCVFVYQGDCQDSVFQYLCVIQTAITFICAVIVLYRLSG